jgi:tight adherence protein C
VVAIAVVLVGVGLFALAAGVIAMRGAVAAQPTVAQGVSPTVATIAVDPDDGGVSHGEPGTVYRVAEPIFAAAVRLGDRLSPRSRRDLLQRRIIYAGREASITVQQIVGAKVIGGVVGLLLGLVVHVGVPFYLWSLFWGALLFFAPDIWLDSLARSRQDRIGRDLPEALDLLAITVEAGLGLEQALQVVSENMRGPLGDELTRLLREIELGVTRRDALSALRDRTDVDELSAFVVALVQADALGVAIADVLKVQAAQVRLRRRQHAREQAAKTPVKILFPVIFGVLPCLFVVIIGPATITILNNLRG